MKTSLLGFFLLVMVVLTPSVGQIKKVVAFKNETQNWYASSRLAIDQGPIIVMIENHRTGLLWDLLMSCPEVSEGLKKLDFKSTVGK